METANLASQINLFFYNHFISLGIPETSATYMNMLLLLGIVLVLVYVTAVVARKIMLGASQKFSDKTATQFDDFLIQNKTFKHLAKIIPLIIVVQSLPIVFSHFPGWIKPLRTLTDMYTIVLAIAIVRALLRSLKDYLKTTELFKDKPVDSFLQVVSIFLYFIGGILIFSLLTGKEVWAFITAMGAASAILLLVFKDTILGFVASIQVSTNDMVRIGDWITMEKYGADGDVTEINLTTVKVQNWDKTITTIPTYYLISDSFKNWRGMQRTGGRRIKRSIHLKISSIKYLSPEDISRFSKIQLIRSYLEERQKHINSYNTENEIDKSLLINGRNMTNAGIFRAYASAYLEQNEFVHKELSMMVRQLEPTTTGMPIEIYAFANDVRWAYYEGIMADIFDHLLAAVRYFDLEVFEHPAADDMRQLFNKPGTDKNSLYAAMETMKN
ncbi:mechanosensitive ion channel [Pontibacter sp. BT310]|uniref:Mechanosensitive ion channel family protein n=1 Tax=Pontibacter populi TaxID=890055 RepID=A0ABS6XD63_9BACT|nr:MULTISPECIES: mechanosensitive ion channel domain-containing protein [Pontibacter]MBJ6119071.1 mechanosensitive ion channel [Pontibacter sp. BT310]MBR0571499.1 mechanosensitive ion channel [Microvirga sp. STS03]MBW3365925.1 mechanosensitive ion channel family protein [Pontibacter populi]